MSSSNGTISRFSSLPPAARSAVWTLLASVCMVGFAAIGKHLTADLPVTVITFFRCLLGLFVLAPWFLRVGLAGLATDHLGLLVARGINTLLGLYCVFAAVSLLPLANVIAIMYSKPIFASIAAVVILREIMHGARWRGVLFGFIGMLLIIRPGFAEWNMGVLYAFGAMAAGAFTVISVKFLTRTEPPDRIVAYTVLTMIVGSAVPAALNWTMPTLEQFLWLAALGVLATLFQRCIARALAAADATVMLPFEFMRLLTAVVVGYVFFGDIADGWTWAGGIVIFAAALYVVRVESTRDSGP
ncbi:MAG: DMT family transporter [Rhodospirillaceae bacterium]|jgi:drug/metabolite transporter (DMT)-like permease|nr:DMT family transporter [Rhodospirillaceae bacterium]MBT5458857.1 DMT family transporter [Rhodospirillaceae bacterium]